MKIHYSQRGQIKISFYAATFGSQALDACVTDVRSREAENIGNAEAGEHISGGAWTMNKTQSSKNDNDFHKGAVDDEKPNEHSQTSLKGQLSHRNQDPLIKGADTDFPEPGENPEHSGEPESDPEGTLQEQDPGYRQKRNQGDKKDDPLVA